MHSVRILTRLIVIGLTARIWRILVFVIVLTLMAKVVFTSHFVVTNATFFIDIYWDHMQATIFAWAEGDKLMVRDSLRGQEVMKGGVVVVD